MHVSEKVGDRGEHWGLLETKKPHKNSPETEKPNTKPSKPKVFRPGFPKP